ncbi:MULTISPECIES: protein YgfX [unclassified Pseudomonas]|uniref:protein YgfX n=1 Tax=unclassified Pseudomonas TaxID=196821 RepID=UPI000D37AD28|nr:MULTISPECIES: protein YgfX [unclassified Pseudomonas]RAU43256.1 hypothetical protein DBP26_020395 [Pseudomonas sp. RIT 409]RAU50300.1 hypothetical protein DBY65_022205 [Pseudomonas sp. RIT 412]
MSSRNDRFECHWQPSKALLTAYIATQGLALVSLGFLDIPPWARLVGVLLCLLHGLRTWPSLVASEQAFMALRRDGAGWHLWSRQGGWQAVQLRPDSVALPGLVLVRFRLVDQGWLGRRWVRSVCIPWDAMTPDDHRRLRLRLKFSRRRWAVPE